MYEELCESLWYMCTLPGVVTLLFSTALPWHIEVFCRRSLCSAQPIVTARGTRCSNCTGQHRQSLSCLISSSWEVRVHERYLPDVYLRSSCCRARYILSPHLSLPCQSPRTRSTPNNSLAVATGILSGTQSPTGHTRSRSVTLATSCKEHFGVYSIPPSPRRIHHTRRAEFPNNINLSKSISSS